MTPWFTWKQLASAAAAILHLAPAIKPEQAFEWAACATGASIKHGVSLPAIIAIVQRESRWNPLAVSKTQDYGLGQIHERRKPTSARLAALLDPCTNLDLTARALSRGLKRYNPGSPKYADKVTRMARWIERKFWKDGES